MQVIKSFDTSMIPMLERYSAQQIRKAKVSNHELKNHIDHEVMTDVRDGEKTDQNCFIIHLRWLIDIHLASVQLIYHIMYFIWYINMSCEDRKAICLM